ncbi:hypothetical protein [Stigmatella aurantiaca]|uniref:Uncharacterized protein n=1 Tax=Stigmatella aurantiaca (strain DW4/3-1) TaxID=378806 RepID=Q097L8_STIAD|nr:hypothetical protein [Stigmatella aurantiaca]ADO75754.1 uncharacterized protein STAUR_7999 [Stigmatella aurantiaca DW4/3-1]EAU67956.1 hypothetical protein STIAU_3411 [Stigmatella aurantiaca DW4/3-1]
MRKKILSAALVFTLGIPLAVHAQQVGGGVGTGTDSATVGGTQQTPSSGTFTVPSTQPLGTSGSFTSDGGVDGFGTTGGVGGSGQAGSGLSGTGSSSSFGTGTTVPQPGTVPGGGTGSIAPIGGTATPPVPGTAPGTGTPTVTPPAGTAPAGTTPIGTPPAGTSPAVTPPAGTSPAGAPGGAAALTPAQAQEEIARLQAEVRRLQAEVETAQRQGTGGAGAVGEDTAVASAIFEGRVKDVSRQAIEVIDFETGEPYLLRVNDGTRATRGAQRIPLARIQEGSRVRASFDLVSGETVATNIQVLKRR